MAIIALILSIISIIISTITIIGLMPYSDNETICDIQMALERKIDKLFERR
jgi:hypothetical protein